LYKEKWDIYADQNMKILLERNWRKSKFERKKSIVMWRRYVVNFLESRKAVAANIETVFICLSNYANNGKTQLTGHF